VRSGAFTFGHRFLTTSGRAGRAIKVKGFDDYRKRLAENFVVLDRSERQSRITRELDNEARRRGGRVLTTLIGRALLQEVPDLVEYPAVVSGTFGSEFLSLPEEVLTTTMIHHQHFFPMAGEQQRLKPVFLAVLNMQPEKPELIVRNLERVLTARLRDARFFLDADRKRPFESYVDRLHSVLFHKKLGSYREKADRIATLARWIAQDVFRTPEAAVHAETAGRLCKADLATDMVRELTELQGTVGGIYAREAGHPEEVWKAIAHHYLPQAVTPTSPPTRDQLGAAAITWAAVSLADKLDTICGVCAAEELPTGSRDPFAVRRTAQGLVRLLVDLPELTGLEGRPELGGLVQQAFTPFQAVLGNGTREKIDTIWPFLRDRVQFVLEQRGHDVRNVRAVMHGSVETLSPLVARRKLEALPELSDSREFQQLATLFKRVRNIAKSTSVLPETDASAARAAPAAHLQEAAELALLQEIETRAPLIERAVASGQGFRPAFAEAAKFGPAVARFFDEVLVMADEAHVRDARLRLLKRLEGLILSLADVSEMVPEEK